MAAHWATGTVGVSVIPVSNDYCDDCSGNYSVPLSCLVLFFTALSCWCLACPF